MKAHFFFALPLIGLCLIGCDFPAPKEDMARLRSINSLYANGEYENALEASKNYTTDFPECDQGWNQLGWTHAKLNQLDEAIACFDKTIILNPKSDNAYVGLGVVRRKQGDLDGARKAYAESIKILPSNPEAFSSLLVIEIIEKDYKKAVEYGEKAWALRKDLASIPANLAAAYHYLGNDEKKQYYYDQAKKLNYHRLEAIDRLFQGDLVIE